MDRCRPPNAIDWLLAAVTAALSVVEELDMPTRVPGHSHPGWWITAAIAASVLVLLRRRAPFAVICLYSPAIAAALVWSGEPVTAWQFFVQLLLLFTLLGKVPTRDRRTVAGVIMTAVFVGAMLATSPQPPGAGDVAIALGMTFMAAGAGVAVRRHREIAVQARERGELLAREAVAEERTRIARELNDVVAHSVSVMVMQAGAARLMLRPEQLTEREALHVVEETGRDAVEELRRILGLLRTGAEADGLAPQPCLARLDDLVEQMRGAGLDVRLSVEGDRVPLPPGLDLSAYRIVQEALANTLRHAGRTSAGVTVSYRLGALELEILDEGPRDGRTGNAGEQERGQRHGHGLIGMRERVALFDGRLFTGPLHDGGYGVRVTFPLASRAVPDRVAG
ncbi:histidine kinase [Streptosporangium sp. NPDC051023]|uniref:sensor histidine kinase n=1 Tax=Streptosporangium sp. NPDC051023 TaxID=3155410 RepID=UPI00344B0F73